MKKPHIVPKQVGYFNCSCEQTSRCLVKYLSNISSIYIKCLPNISNIFIKHLAWLVGLKHLSPSNFLVYCPSAPMFILLSPLVSQKWEMRQWKPIAKGREVTQVVPTIHTSDPYDHISVWTAILLLKTDKSLALYTVLWKGKT